MIREDIKAQMVQAMKAKDSETLSTIRLIMAKIKDFEVANRANDKEVSDEVVLQILQQMLKQRNDSIAEYSKAGRDELVTKEQNEVALIKTFMPPQLNSEEIGQAIDEVIAEIKPEGQKDIGKVISAIKAKYATTVDMALASAIIKDKISGK